MLPPGKLSPQSLSLPPGQRKISHSPSYWGGLWKPISKFIAFGAFGDLLHF